MSLHMLHNLYKFIATFSAAACANAGWGCVLVSWQSHHSGNTISDGDYMLSAVPQGINTFLHTDQQMERRRHWTCCTQKVAHLCLSSFSPVGFGVLTQHAGHSLLTYFHWSMAITSLTNPSQLTCQCHVCLTYTMTTLHEGSRWR